MLGFVKEDRLQQDLQYYDITTPTTGYHTPTLSTLKSIKAFITPQTKVYRTSDGEDIVTRGIAICDGSNWGTITKTSLVKQDDDNLPILKLSPYYKGATVDFFTVEF